MKNRFAAYGGAFAAWAGMFSPLAAAPFIALNPEPEPLAVEHHHLRATFEPGLARTEVSIRIANRNFMETGGAAWLPLPEGAALAAVEFEPGQMSERDYRALLGIPEWMDDPAAPEPAPRVRREEGGARIEIAPMEGGAETTIRVLYYEPLAPEAGRARYAYASEVAGAAAPAPELISLSAGTISAEIEAKTHYAIASAESPNAALAPRADVTGAGWTRAFTERDSILTARGFEVALSSAEPLRPRAELIAHREDESSTGSFMLILTPGFAGGALAKPELRFAGDSVAAMSEMAPGLWRDGQPRIFFGRYVRPGRARLELKGEIAGEPKVYAAAIELPETDGDTPEIERLANAALARGAEGTGDADTYRLQREHAAQTRRDAMPAWNPRADIQQKFFIDRAPGASGGSCAMCVMAAAR